ncbi:hybrid sensor histidine kinase/response regulator [Wenzhouxiangella marina]|uniref:histidine kinase n=1 Tax=Wenzhouxiangella marina TaxID=1579979 RepID=A0A0K0XYJ8_9GAMM|nr:PAS-domain containing protein [Wenzhouxiangella marina]AKS42768.1 hypothetical protein WM2015_2406 [Wenzhouxiangella marina]MBB6087554.1 Na+/proline symporter/signal transduction histidine kinase [Wenzhouxiangella marina]
MPSPTISILTLLLAGIAWLGGLFAVAVYGERHGGRLSRRWAMGWPLVYSLSLAVYCTAWTFYGTTAQAARFGWPIPPTFVGTILLFVLASPFLIRLVALSKAANATSIADFIASRFGKSSTLAATVTGVAVLGIVPYISLQLKAVAMSFDALIGGANRTVEPAAWQDLALYVALVMAVFAMLFGTRRTAATEHNRGLVLAMGFESLLKLVAMLALGAFVVFGLFDGPAEFLARTERPAFSSLDSFLSLSLLGALAMFTLPHQFHIGVVECRDQQHIRTARWLFPLFLVLISLPMLPLAWAGNALLAANGTPADLYVLMLPLGEGQGGLALFAFLGGLSAATGMVILASLTLSIMIGNHWLTPVLVNRGWGRDEGPRWTVRLQRRLGIALVLLLAYAYSRGVGRAEALADIGALSFSGLAQLAPAVWLAVYRPGLPARVILAGLLAGVAVWAYVLFASLLVDGGPWGLSWLSPDGLFGLSGLEPLSRSVIASLLINLGVIALLTKLWPEGTEQPARAQLLERAVMRNLATRFLPEQRVHQLFDGDRSDRQLESALEHELAAVVGSASSRLLLDAARKRTPAPLDTVADLVGQAAARARFSQEVLSGALENMSQGVCVVDADMRLVAWNSAYLALFDYPPELIRVGRPVAELLRHNAAQGLMGEGDVEAKIERRLNHKRAGSRHLVERPWPDGRIIEIRGNPMPGGGFVATFTDVTAFRRTAEELKAINETLEQRVIARTTELERAKLHAERASEAKTRFLAAVSHDLVQPLNAAQLLTHSLGARLNDQPEAEPIRQISGALAATENLLEGLLDISRLDAGGVEPRISRFPLGELFDQLAGEFRLMAQERNLRLDCVSTSVWVESDPQMLRRILQNFLSNAVRYTDEGRILIGCRRRGDRVQVCVFDTGPGIPAADRRLIFEEFRRLDKDRDAPGLGLGLAIADRMSRLLDHRLELASREGRGTMLSVSLPRVEPEARPISAPVEQTRSAGGRVLVVDNDPSMLESLVRLFSGWGHEVMSARDPAGAEACWQAQAPDLLVLDYHLDHGLTGLDLIRELQRAGRHCPTIMISADHAADVRQAARAAGCEFLHKPIRPLALKSLVRRLV